MTEQERQKLEIAAFERLKEHFMFRQWAELELQKALEVLTASSDQPTIFRTQGQVRVYRRLLDLLNNPSA